MCSEMLLVVVLAILLGVMAWFWQVTQKEVPPRVYRIGVLSGSDAFSGTVDGFKRTMTALGYEEGKQVIYDIQHTNFAPEEERAILSRFVRDRVDLIVTSPTDVPRAAKEVTQGTGIPVVFANTFIEGTGIVDRLDRPGGNMTGVRYPGPDVYMKDLEIIHRIVPDATRIYAPYDPNYPATAPTLEKIRTYARTLGMTLIEVPIGSLEALKTDVEARIAQSDPGVDAMISMPNPITHTDPGIKVMNTLALSHKLIFASPSSETAFAVHVDPEETGKQVAFLVNKILLGVSAGDIPVASSEMHLDINYRVITSLQYEVDDGLLVQAREVIR